MQGSGLGAGKVRSLQVSRVPVILTSEGQVYSTIKHEGGHSPTLWSAPRWALCLFPWELGAVRPGPFEVSGQDVGFVPGGKHSVQAWSRGGQQGAGERPLCRPGLLPWSALGCAAHVCCVGVGRPLGTSRQKPRLHTVSFVSGNGASCPQHHRIGSDCSWPPQPWEPICARQPLGGRPGAKASAQQGGGTASGGPEGQEEGQAPFPLQSGGLPLGDSSDHCVL